MAETYYQKLAHKVTPPEISREKFDNVARILEEELSGIVKAAQELSNEVRGVIGASEVGLRREFLPSLDKARTIVGARQIVSGMDDAHGKLALDLKRLYGALLQENAKLSADFQSWLRKFESGELDSEQVKEKDARIKELETALAKILSGRFGPFGVDKIARDVMAKGGSQ